MDISPSVSAAGLQPHTLVVQTNQIHNSPLGTWARRKWFLLSFSVIFQAILTLPIYMGEESYDIYNELNVS